MAQFCIHSTHRIADGDDIWGTERFVINEGHCENRFDDNLPDAK